MLFQEKIDRAFSYLRKRPAEGKEEQTEKMPLEKGDLPAMLISAFIVIVPVALVVLAILGVIGYLFFFH